MADEPNVNYEELYKKSQEDYAKLKKAFDETATQVATYKKEREAQMTEAEKSAASRKEMEERFAQMQKENAYYKYSQSLSGVIKDQEVLKKVATAYAEGDLESAIQAQNDYFTKESAEAEKRIRGEMMKKQPEPHPQGEKGAKKSLSDYMTSPDGIDELDKLRTENPCLYRQILNQD